MKNSSFFITIILVYFCLLSIEVTARDLAEIQNKGLIEFAAYEKFSPFSYLSDSGNPTGIDIDIGKAIAEKLGVKAKFRLVVADETVEDDLRVYIWKGHFTAGGISDVMLHTPFDPEFSKQIEQVTFLPPYFQEQVVIAYDKSMIKNALTLEKFIDKKIGVEIETLSDMYLLGAFGGRLTEGIVHFSTVADAAHALVNQEINAVMANRCELEAGLAGTKNKFKISTLPMPGLSTTAWDIGMAVKASNHDLATTLTEIMKGLLQNGSIHEIFKKHGVTLKLPSSIHAIEANLEGNEGVTVSSNDH